MSRLTSDKDVQDMGKPNDYQVAMKWLESHDWDGDPEADSNLATICYTLQEIGEYEDTGLTPEQVLEMDKMYQKLAGEVMAYRKVGTVEECREAVEKQKAKKPDVWGDGYDDEGNMIYDMYSCPNCGRNYEIDYAKHDFCPHCGQAIDWSDSDD